VTVRDCNVSLWSQCLNTFVVNRSDWGSKSPGRIARGSEMCETNISEFAIPCVEASCVSDTCSRGERDEQTVTDLCDFIVLEPPLRMYDHY
jgi:hypothetical protein